MDMIMCMPTYFEWTRRVTILFYKLYTSYTTYCFAILLPLCLGLAIEGLSYIRAKSLKTATDESKEKINLQTKFIVTAIYFMNILCSYMLMLIVMTFNGGLFLASIGGLTLGYLVFGFLKIKDDEKLKVNS